MSLYLTKKIHENADTQDKKINMETEKKDIHIQIKKEGVKLN